MPKELRLYLQISCKNKQLSRIIAMSNSYDKLDGEICRQSEENDTSSPEEFWGQAQFDMGDELTAKEWAEKERG